MISVSAAEFAENFAHYAEIAQTEEVEVVGPDGVNGYFISQADFKTLQALKNASGGATTKNKLTREEKLALMEKISISGAAKALPGPDAAHSADFLYGDDGLPD